MVLNLLGSLLENSTYPLFHLMTAQNAKAFLDLPPEIRDLIAQELNPASLRSLSLASRALRGTGQRAIFKSLVFKLLFHGVQQANKNDTPSFLLRLRTVLNENPSLVPYIQDIRFFQIDYNTTQTLTIKPTLHSSWMIDHGLLLADTLDILTDSPIHTVYLVNSPESVQLDWLKLHSRVQGALLGIFGKSTLRSVNFVGLSIPRTLLFHCGNLDHFQCKRLEWSKSDPLPPATRPAHCPSSLRITISPTQKHADLHSLGPQTGINLQDVEFLHIQLYPASWTVPPFLSLPKLKGVFICVTFPNPPDPHSLNLLQLNNLRRVSFSVRLSLVRPEAFSWISDVLSLLPGVHPHLYSLTIGIDMPYVPSNTSIESVQVISQPLARLHQESRSLRNISFQMKVPIEIMKVESDIVVLRDFVRGHITWEGCEDIFSCEIVTRELVL
ncbi:hypothetical protein BDN72DRAFT_846026 [Pluteus cervinus]|uniref:Uncharacterized protein n=1 Tax=Pluteus cervinus TaxID=181527 RepID=A0ACD3AHS1_9AGAR|nr:hypothetical protein BDN72DRAFT_846026 [Pluteus cervinus]